MRFICVDSAKVIIGLQSSVTMATVCSGLGMTCLWLRDSSQRGSLKGFGEEEKRRCCKQNPGMLTFFFFI